MQYLGIRPADSTRADKHIARAWDAAEAEAGLQEALLIRGATGRAFVQVAPGLTDDKPFVTFEHPSMTIVDTDPATGARRSALITWADDDYEYAVLFTPTEKWRMRRSTSMDRTERKGRPTDLSDGWEPTDFPEPNVLGEVPVVELPNRSNLDPENPLSEIDGVMAMQDSTNLVWAYILNALDATSLPQKVVTGAAPPTIPILDNEGQIVGERPVELDKLDGEKILWIPSDLAKVAEWSRAAIDPFLNVVDVAIKHIASQTRTPPHYLSGDIINAAAETLTLSEAGLVSRINQSFAFLNPRLRDVNRLMALAQRRPAEEVEAIGLGSIVWKDPQYRSDAQRADALVKKRQMGYPLRWILEQDGLSPTEIERVMRMRDEELRMDPLALAKAVEDGVQTTPDEL